MNSVRPLIAAVSLIASPLLGQQGEVGRLTRTLELAGLEFPYDFTRISALIPLADGSIVIAEPRERRLRRFADDGGSVQTFGRDGAGPGEFRQLAQIGAIGDTIWATDVGTRRTTLFDAGGRVLATLVWDLPDSDAAASRNVILGYFSSVDAWGEPSASAASVGDERMPRELVALTADGRTRTRRLGGVAAAHARYRITDGGSIAFGAQPFADAPLVLGRGPAGIVIIDRRTNGPGAPRAFAVIALSPRGDTLWRSQIPAAPRRISGAVKDSVITSIQRGSPHSRAVVAAALHLPEHWPPVSDAFVSVDGAIWIRREQDQSEVKYVRLSSAGVLDSEFVVPRQVRLVAARGDTVWALRTDEDGVPSIERYRVGGGR